MSKCLIIAEKKTVAADVSNTCSFTFSIKLRNQSDVAICVSLPFYFLRFSLFSCIFFSSCCLVNAFSSITGHEMLMSPSQWIHTTYDTWYRVAQYTKDWCQNENIQCGCTVFLLSFLIKNESVSKENCGFCISITIVLLFEVNILVHIGWWMGDFCKRKIHFVNSTNTVNKKIQEANGKQTGGFACTGYYWYIKRIMQFVSHCS